MKRKRKGKYEMLYRVRDVIAKDGWKLRSYNKIATELKSNWDTVKEACDCLYKLGIIKQFTSEERRKTVFNSFNKLSVKEREMLFKRHGLVEKKK